jgi:hypothetical protein
MAERAERRRNPRVELRVPVVLQIGEQLFTGETVNLSYSGVLVHALDSMPEAGATCEVTLKLPAGAVRGVGRVSRLDPKQNGCGVEIQRVEENGQLLLVTLLLAGAAPD